MATSTYLVIHTPRQDADEVGAPVRRPSDLGGLAAAAGDARYGPKWLRAWSPDLHDDRLFTLWHADNADEIEAALESFGFLDHTDIVALRVAEWGPDDVLRSQPERTP